MKEKPAKIKYFIQQPDGKFKKFKTKKIDLDKVKTTGLYRAPAFSIKPEVLK